MHKVKPILTADGSHTLYSEHHNAHYHSLNGAVQESQHIFIKNGYDSIDKNELRVLEVGFGTGLNAALTAYQSYSQKRITDYTGIDLYPIETETLLSLNYSSFLQKEVGDIWRNIVTSKWNNQEKINDYFTLNKVNTDFIAMRFNSSYDLIYFDAFAPDDQPDMWTPSIFQRLHNATTKNGILVTYCSKGIVKQALRDAGYTVTRLPGPPGKRHMIRAYKG